MVYYPFSEMIGSSLPIRRVIHIEVPLSMGYSLMGKAWGYMPQAHIPL
jgi:hypothetical protein